MAVRPLSRPLVRPVSRPGGGFGPVIGGGTAISAAPWAFQQSNLDLDFQGNQAAINAGPAGLATSQITVTRAGNTGWVQNLAGIWTLVNADLPRISNKGIVFEEARTNTVLQCRDMTNAAWTKSNMTTALTATGIDGIANSATILTASAGNATVLQSITLGSAAFTGSFWLQRLAGSGNVDITVDNGTTWTTQTLTTTWTQFQRTQTLANPTIGIRIVTGGDSIAADFGQGEAGSYATSPIQTAGVTVTRAADIVTFTSQNALVLASASMFFQTFGNEGITTGARFLSTGGGTHLDIVSTTQIVANDSANAATATIGSSGTASGTVKSAFGLDNTSMTIVANGGVQVTQSTSAWTTNSTGTVTLGNINSGIRSLNAYMQRAVFATAKGVFDASTSL